jgi:glycosyltransferase involved in cell wall biosynthesis
MFRLWRSAAGTGAILVKKVIVELLNGNAKKMESPVMISTQKATFNSRNKGTVRRGRRKLSTPPHKIPGYNSGGVVERAGKVNIPRQIVPLLPIGKFMPTVGPLVPGESGIKNSVIISTRNREEFLNRTLFTYAKQTMPLKEFELVIMDDGSTDDILGLCKRHAKMSGLQFQYIKVDSSKGAIEQRGWTPALTNNIGFKKARGAVFIITGPETLQKETNMERTWRICNAPKCVYGVVYKSNEKFVDSIRKNPQWVEYTHFRTIMDKHKNDLDGNVTGGFWWYYAATRKEYIMTTRGVDERFMLGMTGEDDNFADRMRFLGLSIFHDHKILGIHQNHTREDRSDRTHKMRFNEEQWLDLRNNNVKLLWDCRKSGDPIVNKGINWGAEEAILEMKVF